MKSTRSRGRGRVIGVITVIALAAAACGSDKKAVSTSSSPPATAGATTSVAPPASSVATDASSSPSTAGTAPSVSTAPTTAASTVPESIPADVPRPGSLTILTSGTQYPALFGVAFAALNGPLAEVGKQYGVDIKLQTVGSGGAAITALTSGGADMAFVSAPRVLAAIEAGENLVSVFNPFLGNVSILVGAKKYETSIGTDVSKYGDKTWALVAEGGAPAIGAQDAAVAAGLDWTKVNRVITGDDASLIPTLQSGQGDLIVTDPGPAANAVALGIGYVVSNQLDPATIASQGHGTVIGVPATVKADFVQKYPQFTQAVVTALVQSFVALQTASGPEALALMPQDFQKSRDGAADVWDEEWKLSQAGMVAAFGDFPAQAITNSIDSAKTYGLITDVTDAMSSAFNSSFVDQAYKDLGLPGPAAG